MTQKKNDICLDYYKMCGIWLYLGKKGCVARHDLFMKIKHRGPDNSYYVIVNDFMDIHMGFHRLSIMDLSPYGNQPFVVDSEERTIYLMCNGEIYNHEELRRKYQIHTSCLSDCQILPYIYQSHGIQTLVNDIRGEYAFLIVDVAKKENDIKIYASRDHFGVRPLYVNIEGGELYFSSELKGLTRGLQYKPGKTELYHFTPDGLTTSNVCQYKLVSVPVMLPMKDLHQKLLDALFEAVRYRLQADVPLGCLLSGGLDSSAVAAIAATILRGQGKSLRTFSIGMTGSTDITFAREVAEHAKTVHTEYIYKAQRGLDVIPNVVYSTETYDITTIRASTPQWLLGKEIKETTDVRVLLNGDGSDEAMSGYLMYHSAPSVEASHETNLEQLDKIHLYDGKRVDRNISCHGLEARLPYLDKHFVETVMSMPHELMVPRCSEILGTDRKIEKAMLREALMHTNLLPRSVVLRMKEAFSDAVSSMDKSWYQMIQEHVDTIISDEEFEMNKGKYVVNPPPTKEAYYYRKLFEEKFGSQNVNVIPHFWLPKWSNTIEPSARTLKVYQEGAHTNVHMPSVMTC